MRITQANRKATEYACKNFHYAKCVPNVQFSYNIWNNADEWCGCICFGVGANNNLAKPFGKNSGEVLELERVALNGKQEQTSKAVALALKALHRDNPLCQIVVSYSDHRQRHIGTIYQATNWIYLGLVINSDAQYFYKGKWTHQRTINNFSYRDNLKETLPKRENSNKFKYIFCFDKKERKKYLAMALPYPKDENLTACAEQVEVKQTSVRR